MSETAPTTPVKDMPEKKKYGRLMKIGQYSSSPALDDDFMKHISFDCDNKNKYKANHPASMNSVDFRPSSQENIVSASNLGDRVFHKFCKSFSLRFLKKPIEHEADSFKTRNDSSPYTDNKVSYKPESAQLNKSGSSSWRSNSERSRRIDTVPKSKCKLRENQISSDSQQNSGKDLVQKSESQQRFVRRTLSDLNQYITVNNKNTNTSVPIKYKVPVIAKKYKQCSLRRSASQPLLNSKYSPAVEKKLPPCRTACSEDERALFSEDDMMSDSGGSSLPSHKNSLEQGINEDVVIFAEAVWDHVAIESEELPFNAGDVIEVYNVLDREWWWGMCNGKSGWFPSDFVRLRVNQEESLQNCMNEFPTQRNSSLLAHSNDKVRSKIVCELVNTERDFVKVLNDVKEAFISACKNAEDMFTDEQIYKIFGNWEQILEFQTTFLKHLENSFNEKHPHLSCVGDCFLKFTEHFRIYSDYCNNHPLSIATLQQLYQKDEYKQFFESCRVKKDLVAIPLDGFLLTPVQRICKYPLQLAELLKHTEPEHADHNTVEDALNAMREVAILINERKRRMESLEKLILWQQRVEGWEGNNLIENSSQLIYQSDVTKVFAGVWSTNVILFLFDHQLIFCKKDILKRDFYVYKGRILLDGCEVIPIPDGKDTLLGINVRNGLRIQNTEKNKWLLFCCRTQREKQEWLDAFRKEKELVLLDERNKLQITSVDRQLAYITATTCSNRHGFLNHKNKKFKRSLSHSGQFRNTGSPNILGRKMGTWFMFGANRKHHRRFVSKNHSNVILNSKSEA